MANILKRKYFLLVGLMLLMAGVASLFFGGKFVKASGDPKSIKDDFYNSNYVDSINTSNIDIDTYSGQAYLSKGYPQTAWFINFGEEVSDSFNLSSDSTPSGIQFSAWLYPEDTVQSVEYSITSAAFGGYTYASGNPSCRTSGCVASDSPGYGGLDVCSVVCNIQPVSLLAGTYWLTLYGAASTGGNPVYWDQNAGPNSAQENSVGVIESETFSIGVLNTGGDSLSQTYYSNGPIGSTYQPSGQLQSTNLLSNESNVSSIDNFHVNVTSWTDGAGLYIQFSKDGTNWCDASGNCDTGYTYYETISSGGDNIMDLSKLGWLESKFYYRMFFYRSPEDDFNMQLPKSPIVDSVTLNYSTTPSNTAPSFTGAPSDGPSSLTTPTNAGAKVNFIATATDSQDSYYLLICKSSSNPTYSGTVPSCAGGTANTWCKSPTPTASGIQASCSYQTLTGDTNPNNWYAFACDNNASGPLCSAYSQGSGDSGSPFIVNHAPVFSSMSASADSAHVAFTAGFSDPDTVSIADTVNLYVCKYPSFNGSCVGGSWCTASNSTNNCSYTFQAGDAGKIEDYYAYITDNHGLASPSNPKWGTFSVPGGYASTINFSGNIKLGGNLIIK